MRIVIDTNVVLICLPTKSPFRPIFDAIVNGKIELVITNEILSEYVEIIEQEINAEVANNVAEFLINQPNVTLIDAHFRWKLITKDPDDNKFVDASIAANAAFISTNDRHFNVLRSIDFPRVVVKSDKETLAEILTLDAE